MYSKNYYQWILLLPYFLFLSQNILGQEKEFSGVVADSITKLPINGVTVILNGTNRTAMSNESGWFAFRSLNDSENSVSFIASGYAMFSTGIVTIKNGEKIYLAPQATTLSEVVISSGYQNPYKAISETDIKLRGTSNSQEVLRIVPGLFIGQHQGGGKAEQIFLRGFDNDHGTDINMSVDGMPINMVSHAHGQGYADSHFIIPETIESTTYQKGMYNAEKGDLAVTGFVNFNTANTLSADVFTLEAGQFNTYRALAMVNLLGRKGKVAGHSWYAASEYRYSDSYFDSPQHFKRFNFFTKYHGKLNDKNFLTLTASTLYSKWKATGQLPESSVEDGSVGFYGALNPNEGGVTSRTNINAQLLTTLKNNDILKNQVYYSRYKFDLHNNFTYYLLDTINGDEIRQRESRNLVGYNGSYVHHGYFGNTKITTAAGISARLDQTKNSELSGTINQFTVIKPMKLGDITELGLGAYISETFEFSPKFTINAGLRFDQFYYKYNNKIQADTTLRGIGIYKAKNNIVSPKLNLYYQVTKKAQLYLFLGKGFHSNDTRVVVAQQSIQTLPAAYGVDIGTVFKPIKTLLINAALWYSYLKMEYVYTGDGGSIDFSGPTRRIGFDLSGRYQPAKLLYLDVDVNYAHGRSVDDPRGQNYIPLAPVWSTTGGITYVHLIGFNGSLRYRWLSDRAANEDYSLKAHGYFINDLVLNYTKEKYEVGLTINNLFNIKWKETQFATETRLKNEAPVQGITFTAGTKFAALFHITYFLK